MSSNQEPKLNNTAKETKKQLAQDKTIDVFGKEKNSETTHNLKKELGKTLVCKNFLIEVNANLGTNNADMKLGNLANSLSNIFNFSTTTSNHFEKKNENNGSSGSNNNNKSSGSNNNNNKGSNNNSSDSNNNKKREANKSYSNKNMSSNHNNSSSNKSNFLSEIFQMKNSEDKSKIDSLQNAAQLENFKINLLKYNLTSKDQAANGNDNATLISNSVLNDALNNKLLKKLIVMKIDEIFSSNDMNHKIALFNMISNSNFHDEQTKKVQDPNGKIIVLNEVINLNSNIDILNNLNTNLNNMNQNKDFNVDVNVEQVMKESLQNEIIKTIIKNFCDFLNNSGYEIVKNNDRLNKKTTRNENKSEENCDLSCQQKKTKFAWLCSHVTRPHYARGKCKNCYLSYYHKKNKKSKDKSETHNDDINKT